MSEVTQILDQIQNGAIGDMLSYSVFVSNGAASGAEQPSNG